MNVLNRIIKQTKLLINLPYNQLNLNNYQEEISYAYGIPINFINTSPKSPIKLMSGQHKDSGIIYSDNKKYKKIIYLVGKGVLFDAGGYNLKEEMNTMKIDMAGMAIAFGIASYFKSNVVAYCPVATNFIHNNQIIPGDIIPIGQKKVEITNTDAEGRLILAEALSTLKIKPNDIIITIATLTGAVEYAIGSKATGVFTDNVKLAVNFLQSAEETKELAWRLPLFDYWQEKHYNKKKIKNLITKIKAGASQGALFIRQFVKYPKNWIHLDIASSAYNTEKNRATGEPIQALIAFIKKIK